MGRKVLAVLCWLAIAGAGAREVVKDSLGAESSARLYRDAPLGVYASAAPYGAFSFHTPVAAPTKPTHYVPVKQESIVIQNSNGFLKDSYGNKFVQSPQSVAYKTTFPQEFVQLQHLPAHLSQPLAAAPSYHFPQGPPQAFFGAQFRLPSLDTVTSPFTRYGVAQPFVYAGTVKSLTPASDQQFQFVTPKTQGSNHEVYSTQTYNEVQHQPKFQLSEKPVAHHIEHYEAPPQQQVAPSTHAQVHSVRTVNNGKETVVHLETKPSLPLLDLSLLEPLTFANPVVPQVQHYLPKISSATYHKLPQFDVDEVKKHKNEFVVQKTKSYDSGVVKGKPHSDDSKKKQKKPPKKDSDVHVHYEHKSEKPSIKVKGKPNDPQYSYEINSPNHKETYNEQVVSYNKETQSDPVNYTYKKESQKEPVTYSYSHSSKDPGQTKKVQYVRKDPAPNNLVYNFQPTGQSVKHEDVPHPTPETDSDDSSESAEAEDETPSYEHAQYVTHHDDSPSHHSTPASYSHQSKPSSYPPRHQSHLSQSQPTTNPHPHTQSYPTTQSHPSTHSHYSSQSHSSSHPQHSTHSHPTTHAHYSSQSHPSSHSQHSTRPHPTTHSHYSTHSHPTTHSHQSHPQQLKVEPKPQAYHNPNQVHYTVSPKTPQKFTISQLQSGLQLQPLQEFVENLRFIPPHAKAAIRVDPNQHVQKQQNKQLPQYYVQQTTPRARSEGHISSQPVIYEKSKKIIIQEESPNEVHSHQEKLTAQMVGQEENSEEDFEKSYKEAAYGFPAYNRDSTQSEEEIYNPESYGEPHSNDEDTKNSPFEQYQEEGDEFPKFSRLGYRDDKDKMKENYYLEYSIAKPESMTDRYQSKINYYKMFLKQKPEKQYGHASNDNKKQKYSVAPSYFDSAPREKTQSAQYKSAPLFEYDYSKDSRDNSAHASRPGLRYRSKTHFVEPQFQYGFEPLAIPRLDSELDTMASNVSPESEKPGTRKKLYKENWYIKKTSTSSKPS